MTGNGYFRAVIHGDDLLRAGSPVVMGVLNVTPDSFSDGGRYADLDAAVRHGVQMHRDGAHLIDVGGESTRPGADRVDAETETARILPVIRELAARGVPMSVDTLRGAGCTPSSTASVLSASRRLTCIRGVGIISG